MEQAELTGFVVLVNIILLVFIIGIVVFIRQYRRASVKHEEEKHVIEEQHHIDLLNGRLEMKQQTMQHIGREIHDSVGQKLTLASLYTHQLEIENRYPDIQKKLTDISSIISDSLTELRNLSKSLVDDQLEHATLTELIERECRRIQQTGVCDIAFDAKPDIPELNTTVKTIMLRIAQEFVQNSLKHSACSQINIQLAPEQNGLSMSISDNGRGFDQKAVESMGVGLSNMKKRAASIGAVFSLNSEAGNGTRMSLIVPY